MPISEAYLAARRGCAFIDLSARGKLLVRGDDRASYLQGLLTNDVVGVLPGTGCYAAYLTPQGRMVADMSVLNLGQELLLDVHPSVSTMLADRLRAFVFTEEVAVEDMTSRWSAVGVHGPDAAVLAASVVEAALTAGPDAFQDLVGSPEYHHRTGRFGGAAVVAVRSDELGERGFVLYLTSGDGAALRQALAAAGAAELDPATFDLLRVESGRPAFPGDLDGETIPLEAGIEDRAISMTKGCYIGQEVIVRILHRGKGRVGRRLVGLCFEPETAPPAVGAVLLASDGRTSGAVTSAAWSPALGRSIALGYVKRELAERETRVFAVDGERRLPAVVTERPFVASGVADPR